MSCTGNDEQAISDLIDFGLHEKERLLTDDNSDIVCPFCEQIEFDKKGLKYHLLNYCKIFQNIDIANI